MLTDAEQKAIDSLNEKTKSFRKHVADCGLTGGRREVPAQIAAEYVKNFWGLLANYPALAANQSLIAAMDLSGIHFRGPIEFPAGDYLAIQVNGSHFQDGVKLNKIRFLGEANFSNCTTEKDISFENTAFTLDASFQGANLAGGGFSNVTFHKGANFQQCQFSFINHSIFKDKVNFVNAPFMVIEDAQFEGEVAANNGGPNKINIKQCQFQQPVAFDGTPFSTGVTFEDCQFSAKLSFVGCQFAKDAIFRRVIFNETNFNNTTFRAPTDFEGSTFNRAPQFFGATLFPDTSFTGTTFTNFSGEREWAAYRVLRHLAHDVLKSSLVEGEFFAREQRALSNSQVRRKGHRLQGIMSKAYDYFSEYGQSISKPFVWWIACNAGFGGIFGCLRADIGSNNDLVWNCKIWPATGLMFQNIVAPFVFFGRQSAYFPTSGGVALLSVAQSILSLIFLALIFLAIRRRFRKGSE